MRTERLSTKGHVLRNKKWREGEGSLSYGETAKRLYTEKDFSFPIRGRIRVGAKNVALPEVEKDPKMSPDHLVRSYVKLMEGHKEGARGYPQKIGRAMVGKKKKWIHTIPAKFFYKQRLPDGKRRRKYINPAKDARAAEMVADAYGWGDAVTRLVQKEDWVDKKYQFRREDGTVRKMSNEEKGKQLGYTNEKGEMQETPLGRAKATVDRRATRKRVRAQREYSKNKPIVEANKAVKDLNKAAKIMEAAGMLPASTGEQRGRSTTPRSMSRSIGPVFDDNGIPRSPIRSPVRAAPPKKTRKRKRTELELLSQTAHPNYKRARPRTTWNTPR